MKACSADNCPKLPRSKNSVYCEMHYGRMRRNGNLDGRKIVSGPCESDECMKPKTGSGYCRMHNLRLRIRGDLDFEHRGEDHIGWTGNSATYNAAHLRVKKSRGSARKQYCVGCGGKAAHWSYDHADPRELVEELDGKYTIVYSADPSHYSPRCVSCHKKFDLDILSKQKEA